MCKGENSSWRVKSFEKASNAVNTASSAAGLSKPGCCGCGLWGKSKLLTHRVFHAAPYSLTQMDSTEAMTKASADHSQCRYEYKHKRET